MYLDPQHQTQRLPSSGSSQDAPPDLAGSLWSRFWLVETGPLQLRAEPKGRGARRTVRSDVKPVDVEGLRWEADKVIASAAEEADFDYDNACKGTSQLLRYILILLKND
ncbi:uncharacterized protein P174DRAFT_419101 [Aspergillus novofumigatus IBT 16806]|uniref:Uncharacterized protein n=1 Tax=Aspergillus novofumigatus (strain IBT 16806) TaxID=1392255 RepID=A0A2I1CBY4_ASPN1|nr:uncharacterized protein P174DRAFT_419101 [Aspergillus novofumigatus IBT 16806]PKX95137.1 hypothetical protein P174DRAFT_419101 [Aspergillus novofumigatus IBT 16806]